MQSKKQLVAVKNQELSPKNVTNVKRPILSIRGAKSNQISAKHNSALVVNSMLLQAGGGSPRHFNQNVRISPHRPHNLYINTQSNVQAFQTNHHNENSSVAFWSSHYGGESPDAIKTAQLRHKLSNEHI